MDIDSTSKIVGLASSGIAVLSAIIGVIIWFWRKSAYVQQLSRNLEIIKVKVTQNPMNGTCVLDFTVHNHGKQDILLTEMQLQVVDIGRDHTKGPLLPSEDYTVDISALDQVGDIGRFDLSQVIPAGKHDRFTVTLAANNLGLGIFTAWRLKPMFYSKQGALEGDIVEVWLPEPSGISFDEARATENIEEEMALNAFIKKALSEHPALTPDVRQEIEHHQTEAKRLRAQRNTRGWRRQMAAIIDLLGNEDKLSPLMQAKLQAARTAPQESSLRQLAQPQRTDENETNRPNKSKDITKEMMTKAIAPDPYQQLLDQDDLASFISKYTDLYFHHEREALKAFIHTMPFCEAVQRRMRKSVDLNEIAELIEYLYQTDRETARDILLMNGFVVRVLAYQLNEAKSLVQINQCLHAVGGCAKYFVEQLLEASAFDTKILIDKINKETDVDVVGDFFHVTGLYAAAHAKRMILSPRFNVPALVDKLTKENDQEKIVRCIEGLVAVDCEFARGIVVAANLADKNRIPQSALQTMSTVQPHHIIEVATVSEFIKAIGPNRIIKLTAFEYLLDHLDESVDNPHVFLGYSELMIKGVSNLCIVSEGFILPRLGKLPRLISALTDAYVITFRDSSAITLSNIEMGHVPEGECSAGVVKFENCSHMRIVGCRLYGSGTEGIGLNTCKNVSIENSSIFGCNLNIFTVTESRDIHFSGCDFWNNTGCDLILVSSTENLVMDSCRLSGNQCSYHDYSFFNIASDSKIKLCHSTIEYNTADFFIERKGTVELENNTITHNHFGAQNKSE